MPRRMIWGMTRNRGQAQEEAFWTCICGYKCGRNNWKRNKDLHLKRCRGDSLLNRTCVCGYVQEESLTFVHQSHLRKCEVANAAGAAPSHSGS